jgi:hypothetical protein
MWNLRPEERLHEWRLFRSDISKLPLETAVERAQHLWSYAPYVTHYLADDLVDDWPDPWTLVHENYYCDLARALGMLYTLRLCDHWINQVDNLEIRIYKDQETHDILRTVWVNKGKYILNLIYDTVVNKASITENLVLKHRYTEQDLNLDRY